MNWVTETLPEKQRKRRLRRRYVDLLALEQVAAQRIRADKLARLALATKVLRRNQKERKKQARVRVLEWIDERRRQKEAARIAVRGWVRGGFDVPLGMVGVRAQWVSTLARMEPGRWYGVGLLYQMAGIKRRGRFFRVFWLFVDRALNPKRPTRARSALELTAMALRGERPEPRYVWRLNRWGLALRAAVLNGTGDRIDVLKLDGVRRGEWIKLMH